MSVYMSRLFPRSNSSFSLRTGNALQAKIVRFRKDMYLIDAGLGRPTIATESELIKPGPNRFTAPVGFVAPSNAETPVRNLILQRCFVDLVTGDSKTKLQAAARFDDVAGQNDAAVGGSNGEQPLVLPRRFRKQRAWLELRNMWRRNVKVKGFIAEKVRGGYSVGIAGNLAFLPNRQLMGRRFTGDRFIIESLTPKNFVVAKAG